VHASQPTSSAEPTAVAVRSIEIMAGAGRADFDAAIHPECVNHEAKSEPPACRAPGPDGWFAAALWLRDAFGDFRHEINHAVAHGDLVAVHATMRGRHMRTFVLYTPEGEVDQAFPATGKAFEITQSHWLRVKDGQVIEHWANRDDLGLAQQLGWVPPTPWYLLRMALARNRARRPRDL
jgi:predicted ester cyclase